MNSFGTDEFTKEHLKNFHADKGVDFFTMLQSRYPLMFSESLAPIPTKPPTGISDALVFFVFFFLFSPLLSFFSARRWYPPGSGEVFDSFRRSGLMDRFIAEGKEYFFISNIENLGAMIDNRSEIFFLSSLLLLCIEIMTVFFFVFQEC
jgi:UTP--glucose-1-phosphate uridylyltransferase